MPVKSGYSFNCNSGFWRWSSDQFSFDSDPRLHLSLQAQQEVRKLG